MLDKIFKVKHNIDVLPDTEAEDFFVGTIMPLCKDEVACQIGGVCGREFNRYVISHNDYKTVKPLINKMSGKDNNINWVKIAAGGLAVVAVGGVIFYFTKGKKKSTNFGIWDSFFNDTVSGDYFKELDGQNAFLMRWPKEDKVDYSDIIDGFKTGEFAKNFKELDVPQKFETAHINELWKEDDDVLGIMHNVSFKDLGKFGDELKEKIPELKTKDFVHFPCIGFTDVNVDWYKE